MKAVVLSSGGMDSSTLLVHVVRELGATEVYALAVDYGQRHRRELTAGAWQCRQLPAIKERRVARLGALHDLTQGASALTDTGVAMPALRDLSAAQLSQPITYVPNRNMTLLALAAAYAESRGCTRVYYGAQAQDEYGYWDCTGEFVTRLNAVLALNHREAVTVAAPFSSWRKADVLRHGLRLGVNFRHTWTCYQGGRLACGICPSCVERLKAFAEVGIPDPLPYATESSAP